MTVAGWGVVATAAPAHRTSYVARYDTDANLFTTAKTAAQWDRNALTYAILITKQSWPANAVRGIKVESLFWQLYVHQQNQPQYAGTDFLHAARQSERNLATLTRDASG